MTRRFAVAVLSLVLAIGFAAPPTLAADKDCSDFRDGIACEDLR